MGKHSKDGSSEEDATNLNISIEESPSSGHKKRKKHKKKHKRRHHGDMEGARHHGDIDSALRSPNGGENKPIKLKIKIGAETLGTTSVHTPDEQTYRSVAVTDYVNVTDSPGATKVGKVGSKDSSVVDEEEEKWLDALESGDLDDAGELKKVKDLNLLTSRQKAILHGNPVEDLLQLPSGYKIKQLTEEQMQHRKQRAHKRRQQAHEKREKDKKQTLDRLLKKQDAKLKGGKLKSGSHKVNIARFRYLNNSDRITISVPHGYSLPLKPQGPKTAPVRTMCGVAGCENPKRYSCSKTGVPLCSFECYKKNIAIHQTHNLTSSVLDLSSTLQT